MSRERRVRVVPDRRLAGSGGDNGGGGCDGARGAAAGSEVATARSRAQRAERVGGGREQAHREGTSSVGLRGSCGIRRTGGVACTKRRPAPEWRRRKPRAHGARGAASASRLICSGSQERRGLSGCGCGGRCTAALTAGEQ